MKIVRSFKSDPHPSIIPFHSFIITPSYALITMYVLFLYLGYLGLGVFTVYHVGEMPQGLVFPHLDNHRVSLTDSFFFFFIGRTSRH